MSVKEGLVKFTDENNLSKLLEMNQALYYEIETDATVIEPIHGENIASWIDNTLNFTATPFYRVLEDLNRHYNTNIQLANDTLYNCPFTSDFKEIELSTILKTLEAVFQTNPINQRLDTILITGENALNKRLENLIKN